MTNIAEAIFVAGIVVLAIVAGKVDPIKRPFKVDVCLVDSGPEAEDVSTVIWSDQIAVYFEKYPGSYCGKCTSARECPKD